MLTVHRKRNFDFQNRNCAFCFPQIYCEEASYNVNIVPPPFHSTVAWPLTTSMDKLESFSLSTVSPKHCFRNHGSRPCQPMPKRCTVSCSTAWAFPSKMAGWTSRAGCSSSSPLRMSRGRCVAQTTKQPSCSGNLKSLVWLNENAEVWASQVWCMWKTFRQNRQNQYSRIVIFTILEASKSRVKTLQNRVSRPFKIAM